MVTARNHPKRWIFPKGQPEEDKKDREVAVNEAFEEAGIIGTLQGKSFKLRVEKKSYAVTYKFYPFRISKICRRWPEQKLRKRKLIKAENALIKLAQTPYSEALDVFLKKNQH